MTGSRALRPGRSVRFVGSVALCLLAAFGAARVSDAHGFGQRYDLPLPLPLWLAGAGASIVLSFVVAALMLRSERARAATAHRDLLASWLGRALTRAPVVVALQAASSGLWVLAIAAGLLGRQDAYANIAPTLVWVIGWVGLSFASIFLGDVWAVFHPLGGLFGWADTAFRRLTGRSLALEWRLPPSVGVWPAVALFAWFAWLELVWSASDVPRSLGEALSIYSVVTLLGMVVFGRHRWLAHAEFFSVAFGVLARFAPFELRPATDTTPRAWKLRLPGIGLLEGLPLSVSQMLFIVGMLATVTFDGVLETRQWLDIADRLSIAPAMQPVLAMARSAGFSDDEALGSIGLAAVPILFGVALFGSAWLTRRAALGPGRAAASEVPRTSEIARTSVATLVPIAIAYHLAHYVSMLFVSGQYAIPLASDPFGFGWDLFGTADYRVDIGLLGVRFVWYFAAIAIVAGHVVSVVLAHMLALRDFRSRRAALCSQFPSLVLMIGYTMLSLWILAQPIVE